jgi:hypothetical protein
MKEALKKTAWRLFGLLPHKLPHTGDTAFRAFCEKIFKIYDIPALESYRQAIATMILHIPPTKMRKPLAFFAVSIRKAQANEIAYQTIRKIQEEQKKAVASLVSNSDDGKSVSNDALPAASS